MPVSTELFTVGVKTETTSSADAVATPIALIGNSFMHCRSVTCRPAVNTRSTGIARGTADPDEIITLDQRMNCEVVFDLMQGASATSGPIAAQHDLLKACCLRPNVVGGAMHLLPTSARSVWGSQFLTLLGQYETALMRGEGLLGNLEMTGVPGDTVDCKVTLEGNINPTFANSFFDVADWNDIATEFPAIVSVNPAYDDNPYWQAFGTILSIDGNTNLSWDKWTFNLNNTFNHSLRGSAARAVDLIQFRRRAPTFNIRFKYIPRATLDLLRQLAEDRNDDGAGIPVSLDYPDARGFKLDGTGVQVAGVQEVPVDGILYTDVTFAMKRDQWSLQFD